MLGGRALKLSPAFLESANKIVHSPARVGGGGGTEGVLLPETLVVDGLGFQVLSFTGGVILYHNFCADEPRSGGSRACEGRRQVSRADKDNALVCM